MLNNRTDRIRLLKYLITGTFILIFVGLIITSGALAQWPPYNDYSDFSESFFNPTFSLSNSPYTYSFTSSSFPSFEFRGSENYENYINGDTFSQYNNNFSPYYNNSFPSTFSSFPGSLPEGIYGGPYGGLYALSPSYNYSNGRGYDFFSPSPNFSFEPNPYPYMTSLSLGPWASPSPWQGVTFTPNNSWTGNWWTGLPRYAPVGQSEPDPERIAALAAAPQKIDGEWQSQQLDEDGDLKINRENKIFKMLDSSLPLGEGSLTKFSYSTKLGEAPISFKAEFDSGYTAEFTGTADNNLPIILGFGGQSTGYFHVEGEYVIKDSDGQRVDKGTFSLCKGNCPPFE